MFGSKHLALAKAAIRRGNNSTILASEAGISYMVEFDMLMPSRAASYSPHWLELGPCGLTSSPMQPFNFFHFNAMWIILRGFPCPLFVKR